jgi:flagellar hook-associated protein 1 FlgK
MTSNLISIAASGTKAARAALDITAQNIANASTAGYVRRSVTLSELSVQDSGASYGDISQFGVRVAGIVRNADSFLQSEVRRTASDSSRADTLVSGLTNVSNAVETSGVYDSLINFQAALTKLTSTPTDSAMRANALESGRTLAQSFNVAANSLQSTITGMQEGAANGVSNLNDLATSLAKLNMTIATDTDPASNSATLLDQRDAILEKMSKIANITTTFNANKTVSVQLGGSSGPALVSNITAGTVTMATAASGAISFSVGALPATLSGGTLAGYQQGITAGISAMDDLDTQAQDLMDLINTAQAAGVDLNGTTGAAMFSGTGAADMAISLTSGSQIAAAPSGSAANSMNASNLTTMLSTMSTDKTSGNLNDLIFKLNSAVSSNTTTRDTLETIASNASTALASQAGVDLDTEAANLVRYQQAFQASGKVIQVANTLFDQLLNL